MHKVQVKGILTAHNGMNLYRGCTHGCIYCDARSDCYHMMHQFEDIEVKENAISRLSYALSHKRKKCMIGCGAMSDPYIPLELEIQSVRKALQLAYDKGFGFTLLTKSNLILRDLDLLQKLHQRSKCVVQMTLTTYDEQLCKIIEPNVCTTKERVAVLMKLAALGIPTIVWLCPILPFINDTMENIAGLLDACIKAKVYGIVCFGMGLTLRDGNREYFYQHLDQSFPHLKEKYIRVYGNRYELDSPHEKELMEYFHNTCSQHNIVHDNDELFHYLNHYENKQQSTQLCLFD